MKWAYAGIFKGRGPILGFSRGTKTLKKTPKTLRDPKFFFEIQGALPPPLVGQSCCKISANNYAKLQVWAEINHTIYSGDLNTGYIWIPNFSKSRLQMVSLWARFYVLEQPFKYHQYIRKQDGFHLSSIQMVGLFSIQIAFKYQTIQHPTSFWPLEYLTSSLFRSPLYLLLHDKSVKLC